MRYQERLILVAYLVCSLLQVPASDRWAFGTSTQALVVADSGHMVFDATAVLDVAVVVDLRTPANKLNERIGRCMATREYTSQECTDSVTDGEF